MSILPPIGNGKTVALLATKEDRAIAFEIETGKSDVTANVRKCLGAGFDKITVVATSARVRDKLCRILPKHHAVELLTPSELLQRNRW